MKPQTSSQAMTTAERKAHQRDRDRAAGFTELLVKVHRSRVKDMRQAETEMRTPKTGMEHPA